LIEAILHIGRLRRACLSCARSKMKNAGKPLPRMERMQARRRRVRGLLLRFGIACVFCSVLVATCAPRAIPPPHQRLYNVCIAEGASELRILVQVEGIFPRDRLASPPYTHRPTAMYAFVVNLDGSISGVRLPADDERSLNGLIVFGHNSELYAFGEAHMTGGRTLHRITPNEFRMLADEERDEMFLKLQIRDASPPAVDDRLATVSEESGWKLTHVEHGGLYDLDYVSETFQVRLSAEIDADPQVLRVSHMRMESESLIYVERNKIDGGHLQTP
jgi:hypothetical protein